MDNQFSYSPLATIPVNHTPATQLLSHSPTMSCLWLSVSSLWNNSLTGKLYPTSNMYIVIFPNFLGDLNSTCLSLLNDVRIPVSTIIEATGQFSLWLLPMQSFLMTSCLWQCGLSYVPLYLGPSWHLINVWEPCRKKGHTRHRRALSSSSQALCARTEHIYSLQLASDPLSL